VYVLNRSGDNDVEGIALQVSQNETQPDMRSRSNNQRWYIWNLCQLWILTQK